ncbi:MAG: methyltransferase domain-containing protein [Bacteroidota bacterium]
MKKLDIYLQDVRISKAKQFIKKGSSVLDIGTDDGIMFEKLSHLIDKGVGIEPTVEIVINKGKYSILPGYFPEAMGSSTEQFDAITMLAVLEHVPTEQQKTLGANCAKYLKKGGKVIITVPSPQVDLILDVLGKLKLIDGMQLHEHYGFKPSDTETIFADGFKLHTKKTFQLGLNNLFVFEKI